MATSFVHSGRLCACLGSRGLWCSEDSAASFVQVTGVHTCRMVDWGHPAPGQSEPALFMFGKVSETENDESLYLHEGEGTEWVRISNASFALGRALHGPLAASKKRFGRVWIGTSGTGVLEGHIEI